MRYELLTPETAPDNAGPLLNGVQAKMGGLLPNLYRQMAGTPIVLEAYLMLTDLLSRSSFSPAEQQLILLTASARNGCLYCVAAHSSGGRMAKLDTASVTGLLRNDFSRKKIMAMASAGGKAWVFVDEVVVE